ncbi:hypothetical protein V5O48_006612 [Marasmius crinis-equi]|uniref:Alpha/beta-hydrolase n=1 Tax=Marasmius crinis-equi TaxID=585013 RepID=A0ABR3FJ12_9AGAR
MRLTTTFLGSAVFLCALTSAQDVSWPWDKINPSDSLDWVPCLNDLQCARFNVPLNYSDPSVGTATIAMARIPSNLSSDDPSYRGPLLFNPGGPGSSGIDFMINNGRQLAALLPVFDFVSFDPREIEKAQWDLNNPVANGVNGTGIQDGIPRLWAQSQVLGQLARDRDTSGTLKYMTTDNVARDMMKVVEAHNRTKINFYGISYGTALGATLAAMFPDRIERLILDGVLETNAYYSGDWSVQLETADKALQLFFDECFQVGPDKCAFHASSSDEIKKNVFDLLEAVRLNPVPVYDGPTSAYGIIDYAALKMALQQVTRSPYFGDYPLLAEGLASLKSGNGSAIFELLAQEVYGTNANESALNAAYTIERTRETEIAVSCSDMQEITDKPADLLAYFEKINNISVFVDFLLPQRIRCSGWKIHPQHFTGPITGNTSFPILFIANTADPVTPVSTAKSMSERFPGSVVSIQDSGAHTSISAPSQCTIGRIVDYLINGKLPEADSASCPVDVKPFEPLLGLPAKRDLGRRLGGPLGGMGKRRAAQNYLL